MKPSLRGLLTVVVLYGTTLGGYAEADVRGFVEGAAGVRFGDELTEKHDQSLLETRLQLKADYFPPFLDDYSGEVFIRADGVGDGYDEELRGELRDANLFIEPVEWGDLKAGRQVLTWGTGDYLFINDLFPKDFLSFFAGRHDEYLKLPSDAVRLRLFAEKFTIDGAYIWDFSPSETVTGERFSYFDSLKGRIAGADSSHEYADPGGGEAALRIYGTVKRFEAAAYYFDGHYKEPRGVLNAASGSFYYPPLRVYGASLRGPLAGGVANVEAGVYESRDDPGGARWDVENGAFKYMAGFSKDLGGDVSAGVQYMVDQMDDYNSYAANLPAGSVKRDEYRHLATASLTALTAEQTVKAGFFVFYSPSDKDYYIRPSVAYSMTDSMKITVGGNLFGGVDSTEFGQFGGNDNAYVRVRYGF